MFQSAPATRILHQSSALCRAYDGQNFHLFARRRIYIYIVFVAVIAAHELIAEYFPAVERDEGQALSVYGHVAADVFPRSVDGYSCIGERSFGVVEHIVHCLYARHYAALLAYLDLYEVGVKYYAVLNGCKIEVAGRAVFACPDCLHEVIAEGGEEVLGYRLASVHGEVILRAVLVAVKHYHLAAELAYLRPHLTVRSIKAEIVCRQGVSSRLARAAHRRKLIVGKVFPCQLFRRLGGYLFKPLEGTGVSLFNAVGEGTVLYALWRFKGVERQRESRILKGYT